ncbi:putative LRR containing protein, partial [Trachipleistophora hominis]
VSMLPNLYSYIESVVRYIILFETNPEVHHDNYIIVDDLNDTGMVGLLEALLKKQKFYSFRYRSEKFDFKKNSHTKKDAKNLSLHYINRYFGVRREQYRHYYELLENDRNDTYKVIHVPFKRPLFQKIVKLSKDNIPDFTVEEVCVIFKYILPYKDRLPLITYAICIFLQENPSLADELNEARKDITRCGDNTHLKSLYSFIFGQNDTAIIFRDAVSSNIALTLRDIYANKAYSYKNPVGEYLFHLELDLEKLSIGFLFNRLYMDVVFLTNNMRLLQEKFQVNAANSSLDIEIHYVDDKTHEQEVTMVSGDQLSLLELNFISNCAFLQHNSINDVIVEFVGLNQEIDAEIFNESNVIRKIVCKFCSVEFVKSLPKHVTILRADFKETTYGDTKDSFVNITDVTYTESNFYEDIVPSDASKIRSISKSIFFSGSSISIDDTCPDITIQNTAATIKVCGLSMVAEVVLTESLFSCFKLMNKHDDYRLIEINEAVIQGAAEISVSMQIIALINVKLSSESKIVFGKGHTYITISESTGLFDLKCYIGIELCFNKDMLMMISPKGDSNQQLSQLILCGVKFVEKIHMPNRYERIEFKGITTAKDSAIILGDKCKELSIVEFNGVIDMRHVINFDSVTIHASMNEEASIKFIGLSRVSHLFYHNLYYNVNVCQLLAENFYEIEHLQFDTNCPFRDCEDIEKYHMYTGLRFIRVGNQRYSPYQLTKYLSKQDKADCAAISSLLDSAANFILNIILKQSANSTIKKLELLSAAVSCENYKLFKAQKGLEILKFALKILQVVFFILCPSL